METGGPRVTSKRAAGPSEAADRRSPLHGRVQLGPPPCPEWVVVVVVSSCWGFSFLFLCVQSKKETLLSIKSSRNRAKELDRTHRKYPAPSQASRLHSGGEGGPRDRQSTPPPGSLAGFGLLARPVDAVLGAGGRHSTRRRLAPRCDEAHGVLPPEAAFS